MQNNCTGLLPFSKTNHTIINKLQNLTTLIFATQNQNKAQEIRELLPVNYDLKTLADISITEDIPETGSTLDDNALIKARYVYEKTRVACFADDTGLEIDALAGRPGVFSARYAGEQKLAEDNMLKVLKELKGVTNRKARFRTVIAYIDKGGKETLFEGIVEGNISLAKSGDQGFGYDPIFTPEGINISFAEMTSQEKNAISHRSRAFTKLLQYLDFEKN